MIEYILFLEQQPLMVAMALCCEWGERKLVSLPKILDRYLFTSFFMFRIYNHYILSFKHNFACIWFTSTIKWAQGSLLQSLSLPLAWNFIFIHRIINLILLSTFFSEYLCWEIWGQAALFPLIGNMLFLPTYPWNSYIVLKV